MLYSGKLKQDGTVAQRAQRSPAKIKFFEGFQTQPFEEFIKPKTTFELDVKELRDEIEGREKERQHARLTETTYLDLSPKKFRP